MNNTAGKISIRSNGRTTTANINQRVKEYGDVWFTPKYITNIILIKNFKNKCQVPYDSAHDNAFVVFQPVKSDM